MIPVLYEEHRINNAIKHFKNLNYSTEKFKICFITTQKAIANRKDNTIETVKKAAKDNVFWIHYPYTTGCKSDQLNYAIEKLVEYVPIDQNTFLAIYDADSVPNIDTFKVFSKVLHNHMESNVFQQSSTFFKNLNNADKKSWFSKYFLVATAINQTKFTLAHEIPQFQRRLRNKYFLDKITYAHCVGHGLFIRHSFAEKIKFPDHYYPEDLFYGYILNSIGEPIVPIPTLDDAEVHETIQKDFQQKALWFMGSFKVEQYRKYVKKQFTSIYNQNKYKIILITAHAFYSSFRWFIKSIFAIIITITTIFLGGYYYFLFLLLVASYLSSIYLIIKNLPYLSPKSKRLKSFPTLFFCLIHSYYVSLPTYYALIRHYYRAIKSLFKIHK